MTFNQKLKLINLIFVVLAAACLVIPSIKDTVSTYNLFVLVAHNGFRFFVLVLVISVLTSFITSLMQITYDDNKILPVVNMSFAFIGIILSALIKQISAPSSDIIWNEYAKMFVGGFILIPSISIVFITSLIISIRILVLKKNDDIEIDEPEEIEIVSSTSNTQIDDNEYLINEFNSK